MTRRHDKSDDTTSLRRQILNATRHMLVEEGHKNLSMRRIARSIGYSATSIYLHFDDKDHLFHTLIDEGLEQLHRTLKDAYDEKSLQPMLRLKSLCRAFIDFGLDNPEYYKIMFIVDTEHMERYPARKYRRARRNLDLIANTLKEADEVSLLTVQQPHVAANTIWAFLHGTISLLLAKRLDVQIDREVFIETAIQQVVNGVGIEKKAGVLSEKRN